ncbi:Hpt domain-containing protein [Longimicrobium sp.]|uniref:Hpt domain-containing protein n=1 Tax=Longimicrobium sp. TaxID=2029185 RepID=UPI002BCA75AA|nr:Hpt domain-containing protein [Longimicrobium sp.]HSU15242.1 Hpt domain-containing protein [Longimicrobium sp.]
MSQPLSEYFAREAGEYLDRLDALLARDGAPDPVEFFRLARGVRGSAQIAGADAVARVAEGMEDAARALRDGALAWSFDVRRRVQDTASDLRALVSAYGNWGADEERRAGEAAARWEGSGTGRRRADAGPRDQLHDFLRREIDGVVGELDRALAELQAQPAGREPLRAVLRRMRPVRGVAGMDTLSPVLELLEGVEDAAHEVLSRTTPIQSREVALLTAARDGLRAAGRALESGGDVGAMPELERFREARERLEGSGDGGDAGVVPVASLFFDDAGPHVVSSPMAPAPGAEGAGTLASDVEGFLRIEATGFLDRAEGLVASLNARPGRFARIARDLADLARGVGELAVTYGMTAISAAADDAAARIGRAGTADEARGALLRLRQTLPGAAPASSAEETAPMAMETARAEAEPAAAGADGAVPIESLEYDSEAALHEALRMRDRLASLASASPNGAALGEALDELFGLLALGIERRAA